MLLTRRAVAATRQPEELRMSIPDIDPASPKPARNDKRRRFFAGLLAGTALGGLLATGISAWSHDRPGWNGRCGGHHACNPEAQRERLEFATDWVLKKADATEEQKQRVKSIVQAAAQELVPIRDQHQQHRDAFLTALTQPTVDRQTLEQLRKAELQLADAASTRIVQALADVADVLTPEQRTQLVKLAEQFRR
jgi:Spy/CpxP family protein refolding chaperone